MARLRYNNAAGNLGASLTSSGTTITFAIVPPFNNTTAPDYVPIVIDPPQGPSPSPTFEIVYLTAYSSGSTTGTILRGQEGTTGVAHANNAIWAQTATAFEVNTLDSQTPVGCIYPYGGISAPTNFLLCDGTQYLNTAWPALAVVLGTTYGGDGTHFNVPDLKGRVPMGAGAGAGLTTRARGDKPGAELVAADLAAHTHTISAIGVSIVAGGAHAHNTVSNGQYVPWATSWPMAASGAAISNGAYPYLYPGNVSSPPAPQTATSDNITTTNGSHGHTASASGTSDGASVAAAGSHANIQPSIALNYIIRAA